MLAAAVAAAALACGGAPGWRASRSATAVYTTGTVASAPDFTAMGFTQELGSDDIGPAGGAVSAGAIAVGIPAGAFDAPVRFEVLGSDISMFSGMAPFGMKPVLAYAFRVTASGSGRLVTAFRKPVSVTISDPAIGDRSMYYRISTDLEVLPDSAGMTAAPGEMDHAAAGAAEAWMIASPVPPAAGGQGQAGAGG